MSETSSGCFGCVHLVDLWSTEQDRNKVEMFVQHTLLQVLLHLKHDGYHVNIFPLF